MSTQTDTIETLKTALAEAQKAVNTWEIDAESDEIKDSFRNMMGAVYGEVEICGHTMDSITILEKCSPSAFREELLTYVNGLSNNTFAEFQELQANLDAAEAALEAAMCEEGPVQTYSLTWTSADKQADIPMGTYASRDLASAQQASALKELLDECADDEERDRINAGSWSII